MFLATEPKEAVAQLLRDVASYVHCTNRGARTEREVVRAQLRLHEQLTRGTWRHLPEADKREAEWQMARHLMTVRNLGW